VKVGVIGDEPAGLILAKAWAGAGHELIGVYVESVAAIERVENLIPEVRKEDYNDRTAYVYEIMRAAATTDKPEIMLAVIESLKRGEIEVQK
jgi:NADPH-dependent glutamate synthase beta subunit-like oxidoreductase